MGEEEEWRVAFDGGNPRARKRILYRLNDRLKRESGIEYTRFDPNRIAPIAVVASVDPTRYLATDYQALAATLEVRWSPRSAGNDHFAIQWYERPDTESETVENATDPTLPDGYTLSCGWHQDDHFNELGDAHFQEEYPDRSTERYGVTFGDRSPLWVLSECLEELPERLETFRERLRTDQ